MTGEDVRQGFEAILPPEAIDRFCRAWGVIERQRTRHLGRWVRAMVISAGTPGGADQADILRSYLEWEVPQVARSACSRWFEEPLARCMAALADPALAYARAPQVDRSGSLGVVQDWDLVDAPTVTVRDARREEVPGAGADAARTGHQGLAVGGGAPVHDHFSPARAHDRRPLDSEAAWRGGGVLADRASASLARRRGWHTPGGRVVMRLTDPWTPQVDSRARGLVTREFCPGTDRAVLLEEESRQLDGRALDADGRVGSPQAPRPRRRVGRPTPTGDGVFRTNLPPRIGPRQGADL